MTAACGHDPAQFVTSDEGTSYCPACEAEARSAAITHERTQMLTQTKIVLDRSEKPSSDRNVLFEAPAEDGYQAQTKLVLDLDTYVEMGGPAVVTVTVEPRDTLNDDA